MTRSKQHKAGGLLVGLIVAMLVVATLSAAIVKSLRSQAVTTTHAYNVMRARYAAESGGNYFSSLQKTTQRGYAAQGDVTYTLGNKDQFTISASSNVTASATNLVVEITGWRMDGGDVLAVRVLSRVLNLEQDSVQQTNGVSTTVYSEANVDDAWKLWKKDWKVSDDGATISTQSAGSGALLFNGIYTNFSLSVTATLRNGGSGYGIYYFARRDPAATDKIDGYCFQFDRGAGDKFRLNALENTYETHVADVGMAEIFGEDFTKNKNLKAPHDISITVSNNFHTITVDDTLVFDFFIQVDGASRTVVNESEPPSVSYLKSSYTVDTDKDESGRIGFRIWGNTQVEFKDLTVTSGNTTTVSEEGSDIITGL